MPFLSFIPHYELWQNFPSRPTSASRPFCCGLGAFQDAVGAAGVNSDVQCGQRLA